MTPGTKEEVSDTGRILVAKSVGFVYVFLMLSREEFDAVMTRVMGNPSKSELKLASLLSVAICSSL